MYGAPAFWLLKRDKYLGRYIVRRLLQGIPLLIIISVVLGGLLVLAQGSAVAPFIYTLF